ncbi:hypothetical protein T03_1596, partial [Trichinella britovi]
LALSSPGLVLPSRSQSDCDWVDETALTSSRATWQRLDAAGDDSSDRSRDRNAAFESDQPPPLRPSSSCKFLLFVINVVIFVFVFSFRLFSNSNCVDCPSNVIVVDDGFTLSSISSLNPHLNSTTPSPSSDISLGSCALVNTILNCSFSFSSNISPLETINFKISRRPWVEAQRFVWKID